MRKRKFQKRSKRPWSFRTSFIISICIFILLTFQGLWLVHRQIAPTLLEIATLETQKIATSTINHAVARTIENVEMKDLIDIEKDENGNISSIGFNSDVYNKVVTNAVTEAQNYLMRMERGEVPEESAAVIAHSTAGEEGAIYSIPLGRVTNNALLAQLGPHIPIELAAIGDVDVDLNEEVLEKGINNTWVRVSLELHVDVRVIIPFATDQNVVTTTVPVGMLFIPGKVPQFYSEGGGGAPALLLEEQAD